MQVLTPKGHFLLIQFDHVTGRCKVNGNLDQMGRDNARELLRKAEKSVNEYFEGQHAAAVVENAIQLTDVQ